MAMIHASTLQRARWGFLSASWVLGFWVLVSLSALADPPDTESSTEQELGETAGITASGEDPEGERVVRASEEDAVWIDLNRKLVIVDGTVCLRQGQLELFACPTTTKEHESVVAVDTKALTLHAALLAVGAQKGSPAQFRPEYQPASGTEIDVLVLWVDAENVRHSVPAQEWVRNVATGEKMDVPWVFAGSRFDVNPDTGQEVYGANFGDLICVSNFPTATLDLPIESTDLDDNLLYEAFTDEIPPVGTPVRLVLIPRLDESEDDAPDEGPDEGADDSADDNSQSEPSDSTDDPPPEVEPVDDSLE